MVIRQGANMEFKQLECFVKVVDKKSFSKASESLYISQPAVTSNIKKLENYLNIKLINRNGKDISMTNEGEILYSYANELLKLREKAMTDINYNKNLYTSSICINSSTIPAQYIIPNIIKEFKQEYTSISFDVSISSSREVALDILSGRINIGFVGSEYNNKLLEYIDLYDDEVVMISSKKLEFEKNIIALDNIKQFDLILREDGSGTRNIFENALNKVGKSLSFFKSINEFQNSQSIKKMVELDCGIAFVSNLDIKNELELGLLNVYRISELNLSRNFKIVYAKDRHFSPAEIAFKDFVLNRKFN